MWLPCTEIVVTFREESLCANQLYLPAFEPPSPIAPTPANIPSVDKKWRQT